MAGVNFLALNDPKADMILLETDQITADEQIRVAHNWATQPGIKVHDLCLSQLGLALSMASIEQAQTLKDAFADEWGAWNADFDKHGRLTGDE